MYGCETWSMTERDKVMLNTLERKILRKEYGPVTLKRSWRERNDQELKELYKTLDLIAHIRRRRLKSWDLRLECIKQGWLQTFFEVSQKMEEKCEGIG
jgi:hypothetical protein